MKKRVVVTGMAALSPIGNELESIVENLRSGYCGIRKIERLNREGNKVKLGGEVRGLNLEDYIDRKSLRRMDRVDQFALIAAKKAVERENINFEKIDRDRVGVYVSTGIGGLETIEKEHEKALEKDFDKVSPFFIPMAISNLTASNIAIEFGLHGDCLCPVTACAGASSAIGLGYLSILSGRHKMMLVGGAEASLTPLGLGGFTSMRALTEEEDISRASIPFDRERSGFVMGEGAGILILEDLDHARERGARIYGEIVGYGANCDANHITAPVASGEWAAKAMEMALEDGGLRGEDIDYINAHGTSTPLNDKIEILAIKKAFKDHAKKLNISSTKSMTGHLLGASGALEAIISILALREGFIPPTINYRVEDPECDLNITANKMLEKNIKYALSNSLGFGGHNTALIFKRWDEDEI